MFHKILSVKDLEFDAASPRLPAGVARDDQSIFQYLRDKTALEDLMVSIGTDGFCPLESLVVMEWGDRYTVLDGNRRLAAVRLLHFPHSAGGCSRRRIEEISAAATHKPDLLSVFVVADRSVVRSYLGFRHIGGFHRWDPLAKARYLKELFGRAEGAAADRCASIARMVGIKPTWVRRSLDRLAAYEVVSERAFFGIEGLDEGTFPFGVFHTVLGETAIAIFVGIFGVGGEPTYPIADSSVLNEDNLEEVTRWIFEKGPSGATRLGDLSKVERLGSGD